MRSPGVVKTNYANAYKEVLIILNNLIEEDYNKIPKKYIEYLTLNANNDYDFKYDNSKTFGEQELLDDTKYILFGLFEKFGATEIQKAKIKAFKSNYNRNLEEERKGKYNPDDIFKKENNTIESANADVSENSSNILLVEYKESFFTRFKNFIFKILHINN